MNSKKSTTDKRRLFETYGGYNLDRVILLLMFAQLFILDYLGLSAIPKRIVFALIIVRVFTKRIRFKRSDIIGSLLCLFLFIVNLSFNRFDIHTFRFNAKYFLYPYAYMVFLSIFVKEHRFEVQQLMIRLKPYLNLYFVLTMIVAYLQFNRHILVAHNSGDYNSDSSSVYWLDAAGGLFRFCGTHVLCLFTVFIVLYNLWMAGRETGRGRTSSLIIAFVETAVALYFARINGNRALYFLLPLAIVLMYLPRLHIERVRLRYSTILLWLFAIFVLNFLLAFRPEFKQIIDNEIIKWIRYMSRSWGRSTNLVGAGERLTTISYALGLDSTWQFGMGLGGYRRAQPFFLGFRHFGLSDAGVMLILFGFWFDIVYTYKYFNSYVEVANVNNNRQFINQLLLLLMFSFVTIYTRPVTDVALSLGLFLICLVLGFVWNDNPEKCYVE